MSALSSNPVAIVLPHRESFGPGSAGAVAMVVHRLATAPSRYRSVVLGPAVKGEPFADVAFRPVRVPGWLPLSAAQGYALMVSSALAREPPGLIEVHNKPQMATWLARRFPERPVTLHLHNDPRTMRGARSPQARRGVLARLAAVTTVSGFIADSFMEGVADPGKLPVIIHNALNLREMPTPGGRRRMMLFAGRVVPDKAPDAFVAACALALPQLPGWEAAVIGADGFSSSHENSRFIQGLRPLAEAAGVAMLGYREHQDVLRAMTEAAIVAVPSRWQEPFGMTALEAMACGATLVCSNRGGLGEVAADACLPVDPDDPVAFAAALVRLAQDPGLRGRLAAAGRQRAAGLFDIALAIKRLDGVRARIIASA